MAKSSDTSVGEPMDFLKEHMPTKGEMQDGFGNLRQEMSEGFERVAAEIRLWRMELDNIKTKLAALSKRTSEDDVAFNRDIENLKARVRTLEDRIKQLETQK